MQMVHQSKCQHIMNIFQLAKKVSRICKLRVKLLCHRRVDEASELWDKIKTSVSLFGYADESGRTTKIYLMFL